VRNRTNGFERDQTCHKGLGIVCGTWGRLGGPGETEIAELTGTEGERLSMWLGGCGTDGP
jgi:hypothetical protein